MTIEESGFVFVRGTALDFGEQGQNDVLYHKGDPVPDSGTNPFIFEEGVGLGTQNLAGWWKLDEISRDYALDEVGNNDGVLNGDITKGVSGKDGTAYDLTPDSGDWVSMKGYDYELPQFAFSIWVYPRDTNATGNTDDINQIAEWSNELRFEMNFQEDGDLEFRVVGEDGTAHRILTGGGYLPGSTWTFLTFVYDGSTQTLYKNGSPTHSLSWSGNAAINSGFALGKDYEKGVRGSGSQLWDGRFDDVRLYNESLDDGEVEDLYDSY